MTTAVIIILTVFAICLAIWTVFHVVGALHLKTIEHLFSSSVQQMEHWPKVSVIMAARNESKNFEFSIPTILSQDYPDFELVVVNDGSWDDTEQVLNKYQEGDSKIKVVHLKDKPYGWLGKTHAFHAGTEAATGDWLIFCDADVQFFPDALKRIVFHCMRRALDHLIVIPNNPATRNSFMITCFIMCIAMYFSFRVSISNTKLKGSQSVFGAGSVNIVRNRLLKKSSGFEWIKLDLILDLAMAKMIQDAGGKSSVVYGFEAVSLVWYSKLFSMIRGLQKSFVASVANYKVYRAILISILFVVVIVCPIAISIYMKSLPLFLICLSFYSFTPGVIWFLYGSNYETHPLSFFFLPLGYFLFIITLISSIALTKIRGGVKWKKRLYKVRTLRAEQRINL